MQVNRKYLDILSVALTQKTGIKIKAGNSWNSNIKNKTLEYDKRDLLKLPFNIVKGLLIHEIGHIKYTENTPVSRLEKKYPNSMKAIHNVGEDIRIEKMLNYEYGDFTKELQLQLNDFFITYNVTKNNFYELPKLIQFLYLMYFYYQFLNNNRLYQLLGYRCCNLFTNAKIDKEVLKRFRENENKIDNFTEEISRYKTHEEVKEKTALCLVPIIKDFIEEYEKTASRNSRGKLNDINKNFQKDTKEGITKNIKTSRDIDKPTEKEAKALLFAESYVLSQRIRDILKERTATKFSGSYKSGRLLNKNAYKILTNETKVFSRKIHNDQPSGYRVFLGLDSSGSMNGKRSLYAFLGSCILKSVSEMIKLQTEIYRYDNSCEKLDNLDEYRSTYGGTLDVSLLHTIHKKLKSKNNEAIENLIFIITDGETYIHDEAKRNKILKGLKRMNSKIVAIGIGDIDAENFRNCYKNPIIVKDVGQLPMEIVKTMRSLITR